jgi:hypothetical protein
MEQVKVAKNSRDSEKNGIGAQRWSSIREKEQTRCHTCKSFRNYWNPFAKCYECKKRFCYDCIFGGQIHPKQKENETIRDVCDACKEKHGYINI